MILVTHGIIGGAIGKLIFNHPVLAFSTGFLSHFVVDAIPHWHYPLFSFKKDPNDPMHNDMLLNKWFVVDMFNIGIDLLAGIVLSVVFFHPHVSFDLPLISIIAGVIGSILPDALEFLYWKMPNKPLTLLTEFHMWIHSKIDIDAKYFLGIATQTLFVIAIIMLARWL